MKPVSYLRAHSVEEAAAAHGGRPEARYLGGGTNLVDLMKLGVERPEVLVDITRLPLDRIEERPDGSVWAGATVRNSDLAAHPVIRERHPLLSQAVLSGASGQLRNAATTGGNLLQRTRCAYFQDLSKPCNKRVPGSGCAAIEGVNHDHAVLGHSPHCVATNPSDLSVALSALDAVVELAGPGGGRSVPVTEFHRLPGDRPDLDTEIRPGELITGVVLPPLPQGAVCRYRKVRERASYAFALASVAAVVQMADGEIRHAAVAFGGLAHRPWRARRTEAALLGARPSPDVLAQAVRAELDEAVPLRDNAYKVAIAQDLATQVLGSLTSSH
ncbi:xanthine dehydrogenase family protein subunit M [Streptomyces sp. NBC_00083]|uniref:FAD binding domain-containing protein n=1 Tax=Streptomyces sp. NBC_00083 TaxID=2975647 RepID=UPI002259DAC0|nr:xanthine dehydrogenase family protein subunit M [Streptomyces sp. NBC_00083]MCX5386839.1 xanthine dehydrogenase family protein subunit M [Streptomyces sp. NBC_00083]